MFDGLEKFDEGIITVLDALDRLKQLHFTKMRYGERKKIKYGE